MSVEALPLTWIYIISLLLGLIIGSFLNVVIYRLPIMMKREWEEAYQSLADGFSLNTNSKKSAKKFNLCQPASHCPLCNHAVKWYDNIPLIGWILLKGRCRFCYQPISWRYPCVELLTATFFLSIAIKFGVSTYSLCLLGFSCALIVLSFIDIDTLVLPDRITLPLLWSGIFLSLIHISPISLPESVAGAIVGYLTLWGLFWIFKLLTNREGLGYGDFKLFAALGAWLGIQSLLFIILFASLLGVILGAIQLILRRKRENAPFFAFGPYLALCAWIYLLFGNELILFYYQTLLGINLG